jgi:K+:H+ antiporter
MGLAQIGEFSFIIAALGISLKVTSDFLYPIAVAVSAITTFLTPYLIRWADPLSTRTAHAMPENISQVFRLYTEWLQSIQPRGEQAIISGMVRRILLHVLVNCSLVAAIFLGGAFLVNVGVAWLPSWLKDQRVEKVVIWGGALVLSVPFLIAIYRKLKALGMLLAELGVRSELAGRHTDKVRRIVAEIIPIASVAGILLLLLALSASILPPVETLALMLVGVGLLAALLWQRLVKLHARLQIALKETLETKNGH